MYRNTTPFETLESRTLMSAAPLFDKPVANDRLDIRIDLLKLKSDFYADAGTLLTDNHAMKLDHLHQNTTLQPLVATLRSDVYSYDLTLRGDRLTEAGNVIADEEVVVNELKQMFTDRHNPTALAADKTVLITDRANLQSAMVAGLTQRISDRTAETTQISLDTQAILTALPTSGASSALTTAVTQWLTEKGAALTTITADLAKLSGDRSQLMTDLTAENT